MLNFRHFKHAVTGPAEGLIRSIRPQTGQVINLQADFPEHWDRALFEIIWRGSAASVAMLLSSADGTTATCDLKKNVPFRFMAKGRKFLSLLYGGGGVSTDRVALSVVSRDVTGDIPDNWRFMQTFGVRPVTYLHAEHMPGAIGSVPPPCEVGFTHNTVASMVAPPVLANSWLGRRALDFSGSKYLRYDSLFQQVTDTSSPTTVIFAVILPATAATRCLIDFQASALPSSRYWDLFVGPTDVTTLYLQSSTGLVTQDAAMLPPGSEGVPLIIGVTKHAATWDMCVLSATGAADLAAGASHTGSGSVAFDRVTIGAEYDGATAGSFANFQLRAFAMWAGTDIPIERLRAGLRLFRDGLDCPLS